MGRAVRKPAATLGADQGDDVPEFVAALREARVTPPEAQKAKGSAIGGRTTRHAGHRTSLRIRQRDEEVFGWAKTIGGLRKSKLRGLKTVTAQTVFAGAACNLTRMGGIFGWRGSMA